MNEPIAWLGTGIMGAPMARNAAAAGLDVAAWNRTAGKAVPLGDHGVRVVGSAADAVRGRTLLATMLSDADAVIDALDGGAVLDLLAGDAVWVQLSTVGLEGCTRLAALAGEHGVSFVDAPVSGTRQPAEAGELVVLAAGRQDVRSRVTPLLDAVGAATTWYDEVGDASRLKLVLNTWLLGMLAALADAVRLAELVDVDPARFLAAIDGTPIGAPYAQLKGKAMAAGEYPAAFGLAMAAKDAGLVRAAVAQAGGELGVADAVASVLERAVQAGLGEQDMAAIVEVLRHP